MKKINLKFIITLLVISAIVFMIGLVITLFIIKKSAITFKDCLFIIGIVSAMIGAIFMLKGNQSNVDLTLGPNLSLLYQDEQNRNYSKNFKNHKIVSVNIIGIAVLLGAIAMIICSSLLF